MSESPWSLDTAARCLRLYKNLVQLRLPSPSGAAAQTGITWHKMMEAYWPSRDNAAARDLCRDDLTLTAMLDKYHDTYLEPITELAQEQRFDTPDWKGRIDAIWEYQGLKVAVEFKTTSVDLDTFITTKTFDRQTMLYFLVTDVDAVLLDVVSRPKHKTYDGAYNAVQCRRELIYKTETDVEHFLRDTQALRATIDSCKETGFYPRNPSACYAYGSLCNFFGDCANG